MAGQFEHINIHEVPLDLRKFIVVLPDSEIEKIRGVQTEGSATIDDLSDLALKVGKGLWKYSIYGLAASGVEYLSSKLSRVDDIVAPLPISRSEASDLQFPAGHLRERVVYVYHPHSPSIYYPLWSFHKMVFEHKFAEAVSLLASLGASEIEVESNEGWDKGFSANMAVPVEEVNVGAQVSARKKSTSSILFSASYKPRTSICVPDGLVWLPHEILWRQMVDGRVNHGLQKFRLVVEYIDDYGVNAGLKANVESLNFEIGGEFDSFVKTKWTISAQFHAAPES